MSVPVRWCFLSGNLTSAESSAEMLTPLERLREKIRRVKLSNPASRAGRQAGILLDCEQRPSRIESREMEFREKEAERPNKAGMIDFLTEKKN